MQVRWAMAGRSKERLEAARAEIAAMVPAASGIPILTADPSDAAAMDALIGQGKACGPPADALLHTSLRTRVLPLRRTCPCLPQSDYVPRLGSK